MLQIFNLLNNNYFNKKFLQKNKFYFKKINLVHAWSKYLLASYSNDKKLIRSLLKLKKISYKLKLPQNKFSKIKIVFFIILSRLIKFYPNKNNNEYLFYINAKHFNDKAKIFIKTMNLNIGLYVPIISDTNKINFLQQKIWFSKYLWQFNDFKSSKNFIKIVCQNIYNDIISIKPKVIFVFEGDSYIHNIIGNCAKKTNCKVIIIQNGYNIYKKRPVLGWRNMVADYYLSWSAHNSKNLKKFNPGIKFLTIGNFLQFKKYKKNTIKSTCFVLGRDEDQEFLNYIKEFALLNSDINIIIRLHPNSRVKIKLFFFNLRNITIHKNKELNETLSSSNILISKMSSVLIETLNYDIVGICFNANYKNYIFDTLNSKKMMICTNNFSDLSNKIKLLNNNKMIFNKYIFEIKKNRTKYISNFNISSKKKLLKLLTNIN